MKRALKTAGVIVGIKAVKLAGIALLVSLFSGCAVLENLVEEETPTKDRMQGVWEVTSVKEISGTDSLEIMNDLKLKIPGYIHIKENTYHSSTMGPLWLYLVYGRSQWTKVSSQIDQLFDYAKLTPTDGRWFCDEKVVKTFTPEVTLSFPGSSTFKSVLSLFGVGNGYLDTYIDHRFKDVSITFADDNTMYWEWTNTTTGVYNYRSDKGDYVLWMGWPAEKFSRCRFKFEKKTSTLEQLIENAVKK